MRVLVLVALAGCSNLLGIDNLEGPPPNPDGSNEPDGPTPDGPIDVPATITITGTVVQVDMNSSTPFPLAIVSLVDSPGAMADAVATDGAGAFSLVIQTGGNPVDGALDVVGARETLSYFSRPLVADLANATIQVFDNTLFQDTASVCGRPFDPQRPTVIAFVVDAQGNPVDGAPLTSSPAATWCGQKAGGGIVTDTSGADGFAFAFELPPGSVQITAGTTTRSFQTPAASNVFATLRLP